MKSCPACQRTTKLKIVEKIVLPSCSLHNLLRRGGHCLARGISRSRGPRDPWSHTRLMAHWPSAAKDAVVDLSKRPKDVTEQTVSLSVEISTWKSEVDASVANMKSYLYDGFRVFGDESEMPSILILISYVELNCWLCFICDILYNYVNNASNGIGIHQAFVDHVSAYVCVLVDNLLSQFKFY